MRISSPVIVGREAELGLLAGPLEALPARGAAVFMLGEAGIGKSRLAGEWGARALACGMPLLRGRGSPTGEVSPLRPLIEALASRFRVGGPVLDPELEPYRPALARLIPEWRPRGGGAAYPETLVELAEALLRLLVVLGREAGCVLVLEDLHDADPETLTVLDYLVDNLAGLPVVLVGTLRPQPGPALDLVRAAERRRAAEVAPLRPLAAGSVRRMAAACLDTGAEQVPDAVLARLVGSGGGNPYLIEELLSDMVGSGALERDGGGWRVVDNLDAKIPATVVESHRQRIAQLDVPVRDLLVLAASLGTRFSVTTLQLATGHDDRGLFALLRAAAEADFIVPDGAGPDLYVFRHALTAEALLAAVPPAERAAIARAGAAAVRAADPELSEERCQQAAALSLAAGDAPGAALLYAEAGRRAVAAGAAASAVALLEHAHALAAETDRVAISEALIYALADAGQLDRAFALVDALTPAAAAALGTDRRVALHTRLAWTAVSAERPAETVTHLAAARELLGGAGRPEQTAALAIAEGYLALLPGQHARAGSTEDAERLARTAIQVAEQVPLPEVTCQAWYLLAFLARARGFAEADECLNRMLAVAEAHALPKWRVEALLHLGSNAWMRTGSVAGLDEAWRAAQGLSGIVSMQTADGLLAMIAALRGRPAQAREIIGRSLDAAARLGNVSTHRYLLLVSAILGAHRGNRREMERDLLAFRRAGGEDSSLMPSVHGLCRAVCALLEEDADEASAQLAAAVDWEERHPNVFPLTGRHGLRPLLEILAGRAGREEYAVALAAPAAALRWNRQFLHLADAVLLGREGRPDQAARAFARAQEDAEIFPAPRHLGLRLLAPAALEDGWGDPVGWLREAEEFFHAADIAPVAGACRALLRQAGASVPQHRDSRDQIPAILRTQGVTVREYEVLGLLAERLGNQDIGRRLSISPRTAEKHVANLMAKTGRADREGLCELAVEHAGPGAP
ncbi:AAA family ATPase [Actinospica durhamensis]|uniref:AAA family ATPase n=1 Tax=Actinospica durhamensis TaxID=1508375 RepID=A0A941EU78_9ACTN|nr:LuxR family transcriptional regulator [Actinospica durhamensis]MBR7837745.1 AAA family ATPase [Actinospica durhamensis]